MEYACFLVPGQTQGYDLACRFNEQFLERVEPMCRSHRLRKCGGSGFRRSDEHQRCSEDNECAPCDTFWLERATKSGYFKDQT